MKSTIVKEIENSYFSFRCLFYQFQNITSKVIKPLVQIAKMKDLAVVFNFSKGTYNHFASCFVLFKGVATVLPIIEFYILCAAVGFKYQTYGIDIVKVFYYKRWPAPQDVLFPKVAKCQYSNVGAGGDRQRINFECDLPMNNYAQWNLLVFYYWIFFSLIINFQSGQ